VTFPSATIMADSSRKYFIMAGVGIGVAAVVGTFMIMSNSDSGVVVEGRSDALAQSVQQNCDVFPQPLIPHEIPLRFVYMQFGDRFMDMLGSSISAIMDNVTNSKVQPTSKWALFASEVTYMMKDIGGENCDRVYNFAHKVKEFNRDDIKLSNDSSMELSLDEDLDMKVEGYENADLGDYTIKLQLKMLPEDRLQKPLESQPNKIRGGIFKIDIPPDVAVLLKSEPLRRLNNTEVEYGLQEYERIESESNMASSRIVSHD